VLLVLAGRYYSGGTQIYLPESSNGPSFVKILVMWQILVYLTVNF